MDNLTRQLEEVEVLSSIYGDDWCIDNEENGLYHITLNCKPIQLTFLLELPQSYPSESPPYFQIVSPSLGVDDIEDISNILQDIYLENIGETVIFQWIEKLREWLEDKSSTSQTESEDVNEEISCENTAVDEQEIEGDDEEDLDLICSQINDICDFSDSSSSKNSKPPGTNSIAIIHGDPITFKKSTFQGHAAVISHPEESQYVLSELMQNKKIAHATHNIQAYRIYKEGNNTFDEHFEDDGEKQAGHRLLHLLQVMNIRNVIVVVSRWYGGVHLGPDRFRLINNAAREVLQKGNFIPPPDAKKKK